MDKQKINWYIILILTMVAWGTQHPTLKILSGKINPGLFNTLRFFIAGLVMLPFVLKNKIKAVMSRMTLRLGLLKSHSDSLSFFANSSRYLGR